MNADPELCQNRSQLFYSNSPRNIPIAVNHAKPSKNISMMMRFAQ